MIHKLIASFLVLGNLTMMNMAWGSPSWSAEDAHPSHTQIRADDASPSGMTQGASTGRRVGFVGGYVGFVTAGEMLDVQASAAVPPIRMNDNVRRPGDLHPSRDRYSEGAGPSGVIYLR